MSCVFNQTKFNKKFNLFVINDSHHLSDILNTVQTKLVIIQLFD